jgi:outer membrane protein assembly factor BamB
VLALAAFASLSGCGGHGHNSILPPGPRGVEAGTTSDQYATAVLNDGPTAYYRLDDTGTVATDSSGNALNGTIGASVTKSAPSLLAASSDAAMTFPGTTASGGVVAVPADSRLQPASALSLEAWIRFTATPATYTVALAYGSDSYYAPYDLFFRTNGTLVAQFFLSSGVLEVASPTGLSPNTSYHVVSTYDGTTGRLYINGSLVASGAKTGTFANYQPGFGLAIGDDAGFSDPAFKGSVDEVAVYAGKALTATQIQNHYTAGTVAGSPAPSASPSPGGSPSPTLGPSATPSPTPVPTLPPTPPPGGGNYAQTVTADGPAAYYRLDDTGSTAADSSGNNLTGTIGGSVVKSVSGLLPSSADTAMQFPALRSSAGVVSVPANAKLQPSTAVSLEAWLRFSSAPATYAVVVGYGSDWSYAPYDLFFRAGTALTAQFYLSSGVLEVQSPTGLKTNTTYHVVSTYDGTTGRLYVNGTQVASVAKSGTLTNYQPGYGLAIGDDAAFSDPAYNGVVDEVAVYAGKALSAAQVQTHYNAGISGTATPPPPTPTPAPTPTPSGGITDWPTMGFDLQRTGYNPSERTIGTGSFGTLHQLWSARVTGGEIDEPVLATGVSVNGTPANIIYAGGATGLFFAFNADTGGTIWSKQLGATNYSCGSFTGTFGDNGSAVIDRARGRIYVADGAGQVHALDLATGTEAAGWPVTVISSQPDHNFLYSALTYNSANGLLYAETASTCDISPWYGRISAISTSSASIVSTFYPAQGASGGGIWSFGGASVDPATNNVFIATGNTDTTNGGSQFSGYDEQVVSLTSNLGTVLGSYYATLPVGPDSDFGATPLLFTPPGCPELAAAVNKSGLFVLYNASAIGNGPVQTIQMSITTDNGDFIGVPAYDPVTNYIYVGLPATEGIYKPGVGAFSLASNCTLNTTPVWNANFGADGAVQTSNDTPRSPISIANGVLYVADYGTSTAYAFNAATGAQLWSHTLSGKGIVGPIVANGRLYVSDESGNLTAWSP